MKTAIAFMAGSCLAEIADTTRAYLAAHPQTVTQAVWLASHLSAVVAHGGRL